MPRTNWSEEELKKALILYCILPFGKMHAKNPDIIDLAGKIGRSPNAVAMKLVNFASLDPNLKKRGIKGLSNLSHLDKKVWADFSGHWTASVEVNLDADILRKIELLSKNSEGTAQVKTRKVQSFFRKAVLSSYNESCCICKLSHPRLLCASHIIPWSDDESNRANPSNGLCLCAIHDRAFDQGLITIDENYCVTGSNELRAEKSGKVCETYFENFIGREITLPDKFLPNQVFLKHHRENIFRVTTK